MVEVAGGDVVRAATAEAAEALRGGATALHGGVDAVAAVVRHPGNDVDNECSAVAMVRRPGGAAQVVACKGPPATSTRRRRRQGHGLGGEGWQ